MMHKCINKLVPDYLADMFKTRSSGALDITAYVAGQQGSALLLSEEPDYGTF